MEYDEAQERLQDLKIKRMGIEIPQSVDSTKKRRAAEPPWSVAFVSGRPFYYTTYNNTIYYTYSSSTPSTTSNGTM